MLRRNILGRNRKANAMRNKWNRLMSGATRAAQRPLVEAARIVQKSLADAFDTSAHRAGAAIRPRAFDGLVRWPQEPARWRMPADRAATPTPTPADHASSPVAGTHAWGGLTRRYKLYVPPTATAAPALVVMLHGCTQDADDFAAGTRMNRAADAGGFVVLYPEQSRDANPSNCWNWFGAPEQAGDGETAFLCDLVRTIARERGVDPGRVYVAGLSAGGAMAALMAVADPTLFAAIAVHSGLPAGAARNVPDALMAMRNGARRTTPSRVPMIVFHGDDDHTVHPDNAKRLVESVVGDATHTERVSTSSGATKRFTKTEYRAADGTVTAESWTLHGAGHAWAGGDARGSHTDPAGVDATREMLRFFDAHRR